MFIGALYTYGQIQYQYQDVYSTVRQTNTNANTNVYTAQSNEYQDQNVYSMSETNTN